MAFRAISARTKVETELFGSPDPDVPIPVPESVSPAQIRLALIEAGLLSSVQDLADSDPSASVVWEYATTIDRSSPFISALSNETFTGDQIDDLFREAARL